MMQWTPSKIALATTSAAVSFGVTTLFIYSQRERHRTEERAYVTLDGRIAAAFREVRQKGRAALHFGKRT